MRTHQTNFQFITWCLLCVFLQLKVYSQVPFVSLDTSYFHSSLMVPNGIKYDVVFTEGDIIVNSNGFKAVSKLGLNGIAFAPTPARETGTASTSGTVVITHNVNTTDKLLGNGGGATLFNIRKVNNVWIPKGPYSNIDFSTVNSTAYNTSAFLTAQGKIIIAEKTEGLPYLTQASSSIPGIRKPNGSYKNSGLIEVDPLTKSATRRHISLMKISVGGFYIMPDSITCYFTDKVAPSVFFKFVNLVPTADSAPQLYFYKQSSNGQSGDWIKLPIDKDSMINIKEHALEHGATFFFNLRHLAYINGKIYLSEQGTDRYDATWQNSKNGKAAWHLNQCKQNEFSYAHPFGAILEFDPQTNLLAPLIWGGQSNEDSATFFSNPDVISSAVYKEKAFLIVHENLPSYDMGRVGDDAIKSNCIVNESYFVTLNNAELPELSRFAIAPSGAVVTGTAVTPDYQALFLNISKGDSHNSQPFTRGVTIVLSGFSERLIRLKKPRIPNVSR